MNANQKRQYFSDTQQREEKVGGTLISGSKRCLKKYSGTENLAGAKFSAGAELNKSRSEIYISLSTIYTPLMVSRITTEAPDSMACRLSFLQGWNRVAFEWKIDAAEAVFLDRVANKMRWDQLYREAAGVHFQKFS